MSRRAKDVGEALLGSVLVESHQKKLLAGLVEATRTLPDDQRQEFMGIRLLEEPKLHVVHPGFGERGRGIAEADLETLAQPGLIRIKFTRDGVTFYVTPDGFAYYEAMTRAEGEPLERVETETRRIVDDAVAHRFPNAYAKWADAEAHLWAADSEADFTTIGHLCREALQEFCDELLARRKITDADPDKAHTIVRLKHVIAREGAERVGKTATALLEALVNYWGCVNDLVQRQEHGGQRETEKLRWEDARRVVLYTALVMGEIDRVLS